MGFVIASLSMASGADRESRASLIKGLQTKPSLVIAPAVSSKTLAKECRL